MVRIIAVVAFAFLFSSCSNKSDSVLAVFKATEDPEIPETPKLANGQLDSTFAYRYYKKHFFDQVDFGIENSQHVPQRFTNQRVIVNDKNFHGRPDLPSFIDQEPCSLTLIMA